MRLSFGDLLRVHLENLDLLDCTLLLFLAAELLAIALGAVALVRDRTGPGGPRRWCQASVSLGLVAVLLAIVSLAYHQLLTDRVAVLYGANVTPADIFLSEMNAFLGLTFGLLIAAVGFTGGWVLEWFVDGREGGTRR